MKCSMVLGTCTAAVRVELTIRCFPSATLSDTVVSGCTLAIGVGVSAGWVLRVLGLVVIGAGAAAEWMDVT